MRLGKTGFHTKYRKKNILIETIESSVHFSISKSRQRYRRLKKFRLTNKAGSQTDFKQCSSVHGHFMKQNTLFHVPCTRLSEKADIKDTVATRSTKEDDKDC